MNLDVNLLGSMIALSWLLVLPTAFIAPTLISALVFFSGSVPVSVLLLITLNGVAFVQSILGGKRYSSGITQRRYFITFLGLFVALFGTAFSGNPLSLPVVFFGLLLATMNGFSSFFFGHHFEKLKLNSFLASSVTPSLAAINVLLKIKSGMKAELPQLWNISLLVIGLFTLASAVNLTLIKNRMKQVLIYFSQAWIGVLLFLLMIESEELSLLTFAAISILAVSAPVLLSLGSHLGKRYLSAAKVFSVGLPGSIGFAAIFLTVKMTFGLGLMWLLPIGLAFFFLAVALFGIETGSESTEKSVKIRFWVVSAVQLSSGVALLILEKGLFK